MKNDHHLLAVLADRNPTDALTALGGAVQQTTHKIIRHEYDIFIYLSVRQSSVCPSVIRAAAAFLL